MGNSPYKIWQTMKYATTKKPEVLEAALEGEDYCLQLKKDGASYILAKDEDGSVHLYGDKISKKTGEVVDKIDNVLHLKNWVEVFFPPCSQLLVEICFGETSKDVNSIMLCLPEKANIRQAESGFCHAYVFDMLFWDGVSYYDEDFAVRWSKVEEIEKRQVFASEYVSLATTVYEDKAEQLQKWLNTGEEGGVLKLLRSTAKVSAQHAVRELGSTAGRPMHTTYKVKQSDGADVVILGVSMPEKEYQGKDPENYEYRDEDNNPVNRLWALGMASAFVIGAYKGDELVKIGTVSSGMDDQIRKAAADDPQSFKGRVIEVSCMSIDKDAETLRHPVFIRMRDDKSEQNCQLKDIFGKGE